MCLRNFRARKEVHQQEIRSITRQGTIHRPGKNKSQRSEDLSPTIEITGQNIRDNNEFPMLQ